MWVVYANYEDSGWFPVIQQGERWDALRFAQRLRAAVPKAWKTSLELSIRWDADATDPRDGADLADVCSYLPRGTPPDALVVYVSDAGIPARPIFSTRLGHSSDARWTLSTTASS